MTNYLSGHLKQIDYPNDTKSPGGRVLLGDRETEIGQWEKNIISFFKQEERWRMVCIAILASCKYYFIRLHENLAQHPSK